MRALYIVLIAVLMAGIFTGCGKQEKVDTQMPVDSVLTQQEPAGEAGAEETQATEEGQAVEEDQPAETEEQPAETAE